MAPITKDKAKLLLASYVLHRLASNSSDPWSMRDLFAPKTIQDEGSEVTRKVGVQKHWQRGLIDRLISYKLIEKVSRGKSYVGYASLESRLLREIVEESDSQTLKWLTFPNDYEPSADFYDVFCPDELRSRRPSEPPLTEEETAEVLRRTAEKEAPTGRLRLIPASPEKVDSSLDGKKLEVLIKLLDGVGALHEEVREVRKENKKLLERSTVMEEATQAVVEGLHTHHKAIAEGMAHSFALIGELKVVVFRVKTTLIKRLNLAASIITLKSRLDFWGRTNERLTESLQELEIHKSDVRAATELLVEQMERDNVEEAGTSEGCLPSD